MTLTAEAAPRPNRAAKPSGTARTTDQRAADQQAVVTAVERAADGVVALTLAHPEGRRLPDWTPGAHVDLVLADGTMRQYSLCGDRWDAHAYRIGVLRDPASRGGSATIHDTLRAGDTVGLGGPRNTFRLVPSPRYVFVAGGIGVTPLLPMIRQAELLGADWHLFYLGRSRSTMAFLDELVPHGQRVTVLAKDEAGPSDIRATIGPARADTKVYACGPQRLLDGVLAAAEADRWPEGWVRVERFAAAEQGEPARAQAFDVVLARSGATVTVAPGTTVLDAIQAAGAAVLSSCRVGTCGTCEVAVLDGAPDHRDSILSPAERRANTCMFPCVSRSCSDRLVLDV
ncbi:PDR/VanB family oxidoreductase [Sinomonas sp. ASV486]|uniref:PDR/VanB family oxidoreductase n=1 Tax=Sinomonas sp. ASV486 TaxID=3051170 RepID=UPI0027DE8CEE|nr:PDR/VanB family oxidoreductase [Sinomonas sp. ASV486]MDQ4491616.1 PDR/VanB family oxidoreductase [Sinomonas sp. ASV486]